MHSVDSNRNTIIQIMRGIALIAVLVWHSISQVESDAILDGLGQIIICFHMPVFFVISGYLFQKGIGRYSGMRKSEFILGKAKHLLLPYIFWTVLLWFGVNVVAFIKPEFASKLSDFGFAPMSIKDMLWGLLTYENYYTQHLWFLYVLFIFFVINIMVPSKGKSLVSVGIWMLLGIATTYVALPHILERIFLWGGFFVFGRYVCEKYGRVAQGNEEYTKVKNKITNTSPQMSGGGTRQHVFYPLECLALCV